MVYETLSIKYTVSIVSFAKIFRYYLLNQLSNILFRKNITYQNYHHFLPSAHGFVHSIYTGTTYTIPKIMYAQNRIILPIEESQQACVVLISIDPRWPRLKQSQFPLVAGSALIGRTRSAIARGRGRVRGSADVTCNASCIITLRQASHPNYSVRVCETAFPLSKFKFAHQPSSEYEFPCSLFGRE